MIDKKILKSLYFQILRIREVEEKIAQEYAKQEMRCPTHLCIGQEAIAAGVCANLKKEDRVFSNHRSHGHYLARGGNLQTMIAELYGKATGCANGRGGSQHIIDLSVNFMGATPIVASTIPLAVGSALASLLKNEKTVSVTFFGDAATEEGVFWESLNFAALKKLPVLFVCENNLYSTSTRITLRQPEHSIAKVAKAYEIYADSGDGNNVLEVYTMTQKAIKWIRLGKGPAFLEFATYRYREHCGPNFDPKGYRPEKELKDWENKCPVKRAEKIIINKKLLTTIDIQNLRQKILKEIDKAFEFAKNSPYPTETPDERQVYAE